MNRRRLGGYIILSKILSFNDVYGTILDLINQMTDRLSLPGSRSVDRCQESSSGASSRGIRTSW